MWLLAGLFTLVLLLRGKVVKGDGRITVLAVLVAAFAASVAQTIVVAALPAFAREFGVSATAAPWALTVFMLAGAVAIPVAGRLGDRYGYRRIALVCLGFFVAGQLLCALSGSFPLLLAGRALAGVSGGLFPLAFGLVRHAVSADRLPHAVALLSAMFGIGGAAGMLAAAPLLTAFGAEWLFWPLFALGIVALLLVLLLPADEPAAGARVRQPMVDLRLLRSRAMVVTNLATVAIGTAMFGVVTLIPHLVPEDRIVVALLPMVAAMLVTTPLSPRLGGRLSVRAGAALGIASGVALAFAHDELWQICVAGLLLGAGYGLAFSAFGMLVVDAVEARQTGMATGVNTIARTASGAAGAQLAPLLVAVGGNGPAFATFALIAALALAITGALPQRTPNQAAAAPF
ncbi:MFS transporter [Nonomuraea sp. NPDC059007]|uniref:MFS transporter n=1 Tax=Nonomuraea sp. NPDC059007 TaxID=3346692 RepID=UPI00369D7418